MATDSIQYGPRPLIASLAGLIALEFAAAKMVQVDPLAATGFVRFLGAILIIWISARFSEAVLPGIIPPDFARGIKRGVIWSAGFAVAAGIGAAVLFFSGTGPFDLIRIPLPSRLHQIVLLFLVGGVIGPVAEELFFRGVVFGFFRRWGFAAALLISTALFGMAHGFGGFGFPQLVGGFVFAAAYEYEKNLIVPIMIHVSGNLALFSLGFL